MNKDPKEPIDLPPPAVVERPDMPGLAVRAFLVLAALAILVEVFYAGYQARGLREPTSRASGSSIAGDGGSSSTIWLGAAAGDVTFASSAQPVLLSEGSTLDPFYPPTDWRHWRDLGSGTLWVGTCMPGMRQVKNCDAYEGAGTKPCLRGCEAMYADPLRLAEEERTNPHGTQTQAALDEWMKGVRGCLQECVRTGADQTRWLP